MYQPVVNSNRHLGTLYLESDLGAFYRRLPRLGWSCPWSGRT